MSLTRIQKIIAQSGVTSRRKAEEIIVEGRVRVNGRVVNELGAKADPGVDRIEVDGKVMAFEQPLTLLMNKPRGVVCTVSDPEARETVLDLVKDYKERLFPVGRLDFATSGALLLTNDGALSYALTHPKHNVEKTYLIKIEGKVSEETLDKWRTGVDIQDAVTRPAEVFRVEEDAAYTWIEVTIREGRNRQIRRMGEATGVQIQKLKRTAFAGLTIEGLRIGETRRVTERELARLRAKYHIPSPGSDQVKNDRESPDHGAKKAVVVPSASKYRRNPRTTERERPDTGRRPSLSDKRPQNTTQEIRFKKKQGVKSEAPAKPAPTRDIKQRRRSSKS